MPSDASQSLLQGVDEVTDLLRADPTPRGGISPDPPASRAILRAAVVIIYSHFERYLRSVNEEAISLLNNSSVSSKVIPEVLRLRHSRIQIDCLADTQWDRRSKGLREFTRHDAWLWGSANKGVLDHKRIIQWMKSPDPDNVKRFYRLWGIEDIFSSITRKPRKKRWYTWKIKELVEKRHNIAHGDFTTEATLEELRDYRTVIITFCDRVDRQLFRILSVHLGIPCKWY